MIIGGEGVRQSKFLTVPKTFNYHRVLCDYRLVTASAVPHIPR